MPLKGQAKTDYQRDYMRRYRSNNPNVLDPVRPPVIPSVLDPAKPFKQETLKRLRELMKSKSSPVNEDTSTKLPIYNPCGHYEPGDKVLVRRGKKMIETVIPELDGDGNPMPELT